MAEQQTYYIGWDVGGWNCDNNPNSRDAIVILGPDRSIRGTAWRGNLRALINQASATEEWVDGLFTLCQAPPPSAMFAAIMAIDTPLGFSTAFVDLLHSRKPLSGALQMSGDNPYLFRLTERFLFDCGLRPLSPVKDMIGSQAAKGIHTLAKFAPDSARCGVWTDRAGRFTGFETYPTACKRSPTITALRAGYGAMGDNDREDALICALTAWLFDRHHATLRAPGEDVPPAEGWIWTPVDALT